MLRLEHVTKRFGGYDAVSDVNMSVTSGSIHSLIGPNGAGKTTLLNIISGVLPASTGRIWLCDRETSGKRADQIVRMGMARNFQHVRLIQSMSVVENVLLGGHTRMNEGYLSAILAIPMMHSDEERRARVHAEGLLEFIGLGNRKRAVVEDLTLVEQRRLEIARAIASSPKVVLLDEPAAGMNPTEVDELARLIEKINAQGTTIIVVEHHMRLVMKISHAITVLQAGRVLVQGRPNDVREHPEVVSAYLGSE